MSTKYQKEQVKLYKDEFLVQAVWAVRQSHLEDATNLYKAALQIDPHDREAAAGLALIDRLKAGKVTQVELEKKIKAEIDAGLKGGNIARTVIQEVVAKQPELKDARSVVGTPAATMPAFVLGQELSDLADRDERIVVLTADLASANRTVEFKARHPDSLLKYVLIRVACTCLPDASFCLPPFS